MMECHCYFLLCLTRCKNISKPTMSRVADSNITFGDCNWELNSSCWNCNSLSSGVTACAEKCFTSTSCIEWLDTVNEVCACYSPAQFKPWCQNLLLVIMFSLCCKDCAYPLHSFKANAALSITYLKRLLIMHNKSICVQQSMRLSQYCALHCHTMAFILFRVAIEVLMNMETCVVWTEHK